MQSAVDTLADHIRRCLTGGAAAVFVGIDGRSGSGKSTLAAALANRLESEAIGVLVIDGDQFYAGGSATTWDRRTPEDKADRVIDWRPQKRVLADLRDRGLAEWRPFEWEADNWDTDEAPLGDPISAVCAAVVVLEGAYSCRPELHDVLDLRVLLSVPIEVRRRRLAAREGEAYRADWAGRWSAAEDHYFGTVMPPERFDLVVDSPDRR